MSSTPRTANRGGNKKQETVKGHKSDAKKDSKNSDARKAHPASERIAKITESFTDEATIKKRIALVQGVVINATEDEIITALHDNDHDVNRTVSYLLEGGDSGAWELSGKKKRNKQAATGKNEEVIGNDEGELTEPPPLSANQDRDRSRGRGNGAPRGRGRGTNENRGTGRGRDNKENEGSSAEDVFRGPRGDRGEGFRRGGRGLSNGPGGRGGRGRGGGGRLGSRMYANREGGRERDNQRFPSTIDTWNPSGSQDKGEPLKMETWNDNFPAAEDWDNEEYTGSLEHTKVFTPSAGENAVTQPEQPTETNSQDLLSMVSATNQDYHQSAAMPSSPLPVGVKTLSTAQAQYLTQLTQQSAENVKANAAAAAAASAYGQAETLKSAVGIGAGSFAQSANYGQTGSYGQTGYAQPSYAGSTSYQPSTGYSATGATGASAFSSGTSQQNNAYSSAPSSAYSGATTAQANVYSSGSGAFQNYPTSGNASYGGYSANSGSYTPQTYASSGVNYESQSANSESGVPAQPLRPKSQRSRVPPPSKIPSSAVEMPEDPGVSVGSLDVQFGGLDFGSDGNSIDGVVSTEQSAAPVEGNADTSVYSAKNSVNSQQASLVGGLTGKGLTNNEGLSMPTSGEHKSSFNSQSSRAASSTSGLDLSKSDVANLAYASAPAAANYSTYQNQKSTAYQPVSYSAGSYSVPQATYANVVPSSYSTTSYSGQQAVTSYPSSYGSQPSNASNYPSSGTNFSSTNVFPNSTQNYQSSTGSVYGAYSTGYPSNYSTTTSATAKLNSGLSKEAEFNSSNLTSSSSSVNVTGTTTSTTASTTASLLTPATVTTTTASSAKISTSALKSNVLPSLHPQIMQTPQYIMNAGMPFYHQPPLYGFDDVAIHQLQRIPHHMTQYYDMSYTAPTSLATGRDSLPNVAFTMADARYPGRADSSASPVPSTLSQQTATGAHQQPMLNHPSFPYTYVYNTVPGSFQYASPIYPVPSAGNAHATSSNQFAKPGSYASTYGSGYEALAQTDYGKSPYVSSGGKSTVGGPSVTSSSTASDLYGKTHTALGKVNSYDKQGFHSATPPPFNIAAGQGAGLAPSGTYPPQLFIPTMPPHQQHHNLMQSHLQDSTSNSGQRAQTTQAGKSGKQNYTPYWSAN